MTEESLTWSRLAISVEVMKQASAKLSNTKSAISFSFFVSFTPLSCALNSSVMPFPPFSANMQNNSSCARWTYNVHLFPLNHTGQFFSIHKSKMPEITEKNTVFYRIPQKHTNRTKKVSEFDKFFIVPSPPFMYNILVNQNIAIQLLTQKSNFRRRSIWLRL